MHVFLTGMMGSGKSAVGRVLAEKLNVAYIDLDQTIVELSGKSIERIFKEDCEEHFRGLESEAMSHLDMSHDAVISTGGGFPLREKNRIWMKEHGMVVWLKCSPAVILDRIKDEDRPLLPKPIEIHHIEAILDKRTSIYNLADVAVDTDYLTPEEIVKTIINLPV